MNQALRQTIRTAIDAHKRSQLFTTDSLGKQILRREYRPHPAIPSAEGTVAGISHSTWGYKHHGCRCGICRDAIRDHEKRKRERRDAAA